MDKYYWCITTTDGKNHIVETEDSNVNKFLENAYEPNVVNIYKLKTPHIVNGLEFNTIAISRDKITSISYSCKY